MKRRRQMLLFPVLLLILTLLCYVTAFADDAELLAQLPGNWTCPVENEETATGEIILSFENDGSVSLRYTDADGTNGYTSAGTWTFELVPDQMDRLTLLLTSTDDPRYDGDEYRVGCVYDVYAETWFEGATRQTCMILQEVSYDPVSPLEEMSGEDWCWGFYREEGPNMRVVKCRKNVSLREKRSKKSACLLKVPLGAEVFAFPEDQEENGFIRCVYQDEYGYILTEYLEPIE